MSVEVISSVVDTVPVCLRNGYRPGGGRVAGVREHATHICHVGSIPGREIQSKGGGGVAGRIEHVAHVCHIRSVPRRKV